LWGALARAVSTSPDHFSIELKKWPFSIESDLGWSKTSRPAQIKIDWKSDLFQLKTAGRLESGFGIGQSANWPKSRGKNTSRIDLFCKKQRKPPPGGVAGPAAKGPELEIPILEGFFGLFFEKSVRIAIQLKKRPLFNWKPTPFSIENDLGLQFGTGFQLKSDWLFQLKKGPIFNWKWPPKSIGFRLDFRLTFAIEKRPLFQLKMSIQINRNPIDFEIETFNPNRFQLNWNEVHNFSSKQSKSDFL
jgi:hypothetical protein